MKVRWFSVFAVLWHTFVSQSQSEQDRVRLLAKVAVPFTSDDSGPDPASRSDVRLSFEGESNIYLTWAEQSKSAITTGENADLRMVVNHYGLQHQSTLQLLRHDRFIASSVDDSLEVLPGGGVLLNIGGQLILRREGKVVVQKAGVEVCPPTQRETSGPSGQIHIHLYPVSGDQALIAVEERQAGKPTRFDPDGQLRLATLGVSHTQYCWVDLRELKPLKKVEEGPWFPNLSASSSAIYAGPPGYQVRLDITGMQSPAVSPDCAAPLKLVDMRTTKVLRWREALATVCANGLLVQQDGKDFLVGGLDLTEPMSIVTDAKAAPVVLLVGGKLKQRRNGVEINQEYVVVNYETKIAGHLRIRSTEHESNGFYVASAPATAISEDGSLVAIYDSGYVSFYSFQWNGRH